MNTLHRTIHRAASLAPSLDTPSDFIRWAEDICEIITFAFDADYDDVTEQLYAAAREEQGVDEDELTCQECSNKAKWIRKTQFAGDHPFCELCVTLESDFFEGSDSNNVYWVELDETGNPISV